MRPGRPWPFCPSQTPWCAGQAPESRARDADARKRAPFTTGRRAACAEHGTPDRGRDAEDTKRDAKGARRSRPSCMRFAPRSWDAVHALAPFRTGNALDRRGPAFIAQDLGGCGGRHGRQRRKRAKGHHELRMVDACHSAGGADAVLPQAGEAAVFSAPGRIMVLRPGRAGDPSTSPQYASARGEMSR